MRGWGVCCLFGICEGLLGRGSEMGLAFVGGGDGGESGLVVYVVHASGRCLHDCSGDLGKEEIRFAA